MTAMQTEDIQLTDDQQKQYNQLQKQLHEAEVGLARIAALKDAQTRCLPLSDLFNEYGRPRGSPGGHRADDLERMVAGGLVNDIIGQEAAICGQLTMQHANEIRSHIRAVEKARDQLEAFHQQVREENRRAAEAEQHRQQAEAEAEKQRHSDIKALASDLQKDKTAVDKGIKLLDALDRLSAHAREARRLGLVHDFADGVTDEADGQLPANFNDLQRRLKALADSDRDVGKVLAPVRGFEDIR
jgi:septal ring factor EnvC (AmiA/AmiB activator)